MNMNDILKDCHTEKDARTLAQIMGYLSTAKEMIDKCNDELNNFTFQSKDLVNLNRLVFELKGLLYDFDYEKMKSDVLENK